MVEAWDLGAIWRLGSSTYSRGRVSWAGECFLCKFKTFEHDSKRDAFFALAEHWAKVHPVELTIGVLPTGGLLRQGEFGSGGRALCVGGKTV
jgi:hypothetical protein